MASNKTRRLLWISALRRSELWKTVAEARNRRGRAAQAKQVVGAGKCGKTG